MPLLRTEPLSTPSFLLQRESARARWAGSLEALLARRKSLAPLYAPYLFRTRPEDRFAPPGRSFSFSLLMHGCFFAAVMLNIPLAFSAKAQPEERPRTWQAQVIYYRVPKLDPQKAAPRVMLRENAPQPAPRSLEESAPSKSAPVFAGNLAIESHPLHADNTRQTILQPNAPNVRIPYEIKLPDIVMAQSAPKIPLALAPNDAQPIERRRRELNEQVPAIQPQTTPQNAEFAASVPRLQMPDAPAAELIHAQRRTETAALPDEKIANAPAAALPAQSSQMQLPMPAFDAAKVTRSARALETAAVPTASIRNAAEPSLALPATNSQARLPMPSFNAAKISRASRGKENAAIPAESAANAPAPSATLPAANSQTQLPMPSFDAAKISRAQRTKEAAVAPTERATSAAPDSASVPGGTKFQLAMPSFAAPKIRENRRGTVNAAPANAPQIGSGLIAMSVDPAPPASEIALPPGSREADFSLSRPEEKSAKPGAGNSAAGGKGPSAGTGRKSARSSAGANGSADAKPGPVTLSVAGGNGRLIGFGAFEPALAAGAIIPVSPELSLRKNAMVVSSGPAGGGGLDVYGALDCDKIYTIFLAMPHENWTMQYCTKPERGASAQKTPAMVMRLGRPLLPPDPETQYDYRRLPLPPDKQHKRIILKGMLHEDGTVSDLQVYRGVQPQMDEAARLAFSHWKFKPASQGGKPVAVQILVGVPTEQPPPARRTQPKPGKQ